MQKIYTYMIRITLVVVHMRYNKIKKIGKNDII